MSVEFWHNPRCSKSREALALLRGHGVEPFIVDYIKAPPTEVRIRQVLALLCLRPIAAMRKNESVFRELGLSERAPDDELIAAMSSHPVLIERPIVIDAERAVIARPPERVLELLR